ncbi:MAG: hypothetical protein U0470_04270 [Anaerolineae bacterium]
MFRGVIGVGATTEADVRWSESRFQRTQFGWWKPDVVALGALVTSTAPGGGFGGSTARAAWPRRTWPGSALLRQARPSLSPAEALEVLDAHRAPARRRAAQGQRLASTRTPPSWP